MKRRNKKGEGKRNSENEEDRKRQKINRETKKK